MAYLTKLFQPQAQKSLSSQIGQFFRGYPSLTILEVSTSRTSKGTSVQVTATANGTRHFAAEFAATSLQTAAAQVQAFFVANPSVVPVKTIDISPPKHSSARERLLVIYSQALAVAGGALPQGALSSGVVGDAQLLGAYGEPRGLVSLRNVGDAAWPAGGRGVAWRSALTGQWSGIGDRVYTGPAPAYTSTTIPATTTQDPDCCRTPSMLPCALAGVPWLGFWLGSQVGNKVPTPAGDMDLPSDAPEVIYGGYLPTEVRSEAQAGDDGYPGARFEQGSALGWGLGGDRGRRAMLNAAAPEGLTIGALIHSQPGSPYPIGISVRSVLGVLATGVVPDEGFYFNGTPIASVPLFPGTHLWCVELLPGGWRLLVDGAVIRSGAQQWLRSDMLQVGAFVDRGSSGYYNNIFAARGALTPRQVQALLQGEVPCNLARASFRPPAPVVNTSSTTAFPVSAPSTTPAWSTCCTPGSGTTTAPGITTAPWIGPATTPAPSGATCPTYTVATTPYTYPYYPPGNYLTWKCALAVFLTDRQYSIRLNTGIGGASGAQISWHQTLNSSGTACGTFGSYVSWHSEPGVVFLYFNVWQALRDGAWSGTLSLPVSIAYATGASPTTFEVGNWDVVGGSYIDGTPHLSVALPSVAYTYAGPCTSSFNIAKTVVFSDQGTLSVL